MSWFRTTKTKTVHKYQRNAQSQKVTEAKVDILKDNTQKRTVLNTKQVIK